jgi:acetyl-CoA carboxylase biotin carboxyl carrier protein
MTMPDRKPPGGLAMGGQPDDAAACARHTRLSELREHARGLAGELRGALRRVRVRSGELSVEVEWQPDGSALQRVATAPLADLPAEPEGTAVGDVGPRQVLVTSPMVGTFHRAPEPGAPPFISVGDVVEPGQVVGIVQAMKLMNNIVAEVAGTVVEIRVADAVPVEFGEPLIALVESPSGLPPER